MTQDDVANCLKINTEILVDENVAQAADLRPWNLRVRVDGLSRQVLRCLTEDLQIPLEGFGRHVEIDLLAVAILEHTDVPRAPIDGLEDVGDSLASASTHRGTASASVASETGRLRSWRGMMSMSSRRTAGAFLPSVRMRA
nr:hypothetical protein [Pseudoclavibacter sp. AY1F1]